MNETFINKDKIFVKFNNFRSHRKTLILIHGVSGSMSGWNNCIDSLNRKYNLILIDLRGHGRSFKYKRTADYNLKCFSEDLSYVINHFKVNDPIFVAHSFGCLILIDYIAKYRHSTGKAILLSARLDTKNRIISLLSSTILKVLRSPKYTSLNYNETRHINYNKFPSNKDLDIKRTWIDISNTGLFIYLSCIKSVAKSDILSLLKQIDIPCLFIHGENDLIAKFKQLQNNYKNISHSKLVLIPKANHVMIFSHGNEINDKISEFVENE